MVPTRSLLRGIALSGLVALFGCNRENDSAAVRPTVTPPSRATVPATDGTTPDRSADRNAPSSASRVTKISDRTGFLQRIPAGTLVAVRVPDMTAFRLGWNESQVVRIFGNSEIQPLWKKIEQQFENLLTGLPLPFVGMPALPGDCTFEDLAAEIQGEVVFALTEIRPMEAMMGGFPGTAVVHAAMAKDAPQWQRLLEALTEMPGAARLGDGKQNETGVRFEQSGVRVDVRLRDAELAVTMGAPGGSGRDPFEPLPAASSMLAATVVAATPSTPAGTTPLYESFLSLEPIWQMVSLMAGPEAGKALSDSGLTRLAGVSFVGQVVQSEFVETVTLHSPGRKDPVTKLFEHGAPAPTWTRWAAADVDNVALFYVDLARAFEDIRKALPGEVSRQIDASLGASRQMVGIDVHRDVLENLGPHFVWTSHGQWDPNAANQDFEAVLVCEIQDAERTQKLLNVLIAMTGQAPHAEDVDGWRILTMELPPLPVPGMAPAQFAPSWMVGGNWLAIGTSPAALKGAFAAARAEESAAPEGLERAMAGSGPGVTGIAWQAGPIAAARALATMAQDGEWSVERIATVLAQAGLVDNVSHVRCTDAGVQWTTRSGLGSFVTAALQFGASFSSSLRTAGFPPAYR